jgi:hypothetical protein
LNQILFRINLYPDLKRCCGLAETSIKFWSLKNPQVYFISVEFQIRIQTFRSVTSRDVQNDFNVVWDWDKGAIQTLDYVLKMLEKDSARLDLFSSCEFDLKLCMKFCQISTFSIKWLLTWSIRRYFGAIFEMNVACTRRTKLIKYSIWSCNSFKYKTAFKGQRFNLRVCLKIHFLGTFWFIRAKEQIRS